MTAISGSVRRTAFQVWKSTHLSLAAAIDPRFRHMSSLESNMNKKLDGKVAIITGAAGAIGKVTSKLFAENGAQVILADVSDEMGHKIASEIGSNAHYRHCDVTKEGDVASIVDFAMEKFGKLDIMCNNAGVLTPQEQFPTFDLDTYDRFHSIMVRGLLAGIKHASRVMIPVKHGVILNTASIAATTTSKNIPLAYNITKSNIPGITKIAAYHLGKQGIRVNAISPHGIANPMVVNIIKHVMPGSKFSFEDLEQAFIAESSLLGKRTTEDDVAKGALFLCSDDSGYISGHNLIVDAGWGNSKEMEVLPKAMRQEGA